MIENRSDRATMRLPSRDRPRARRTATLLALLSAAIALPATATSRSAFGPAETLKYDIRYLGLSVGKLSVMVGGSTRMNSRDVWPVMAVARTEPLFAVYPVHDKFVTWWDPAAGTTLGSEFHVNENGRRKRERVRYSRELNKAQTTRDKPDGREEVVYDVPAETQDVLAAIFAMRGHKLEVGDRLELPVFTGRKSFTIKVEVMAKETVEVAAGRVAAKVLKVDAPFSGGLSSKRAIRMYVTDDERHVPVRIDAEFIIGSLVADLTGYEKGLSR
jgi:hypothetical protein